MNRLQQDPANKMTEAKAQDTIAWVDRMNNLIAMVEELIEVAPLIDIMTKFTVSSAMFFITSRQSP